MTSGKTIGTRTSLLIQQLYDARKDKSEADKKEKETLILLKPLVDPTFDALPDAPIADSDYALTRVLGTNRTISAEKLLERGVAPDIVAYATKTTNYHQYRVKPVKEAG